MPIRWLVNLLLLVAVIALVVLMQRELEREDRVATLTGLLPQSITELRIERDDQPAIRLVERVDGWRMEAPYDLPAETGIPLE